MKTYRVKSAESWEEWVKILEEKDGGYVVEILRRTPDYDQSTMDFISKTLFESCVRTQYLVEAS